MDMAFEVRVNVERTSGPFASRDELEAQVVDALEDANPGDLEGDAGGEYDVDEWTVEVSETGKRSKPKAAASVTRVMLALNRVFDAYMKEHPIRLEGWPEPDTSEVGRAIVELLMMSDAGELIRQAKMAEHRASKGGKR
jgi:hypothetical protein